MLVADTNVLIYTADIDSQFHDTCRNRLERKRSMPGAWYATWGILYKFLRVTTRARVATALGNPGAWQFVAALLRSPGLGIPIPTSRHLEVAGDLILELPHLAGNLLHDAHTAILMREHGVRQIRTRDTDFNQFPFLEIIDPVRL